MTKRRSGRVALVVLDGVGAGEAPDSSDYGDRGSDTLGNLARAVGGLALPFLAGLGLGCCRPLLGMSCRKPSAAHGIARPRSAGKDSTTGHWEICELVLERPFPTFPHGFPQAVIGQFADLTGRPVIGNQPGAGTQIIDELGQEQYESGAWIVYTSVDSVFQVAAHEERIPVDELYRACQLARDHVLTGPYAVSRVIARPFAGVPGEFARTPRRKDFSVAPPRPTLLDRLAEIAVPRIGVGKVDDLFAGRNISSRHAGSNQEAYALIGAALDSLESGFLFANVVEFDQTWGHRNDVAGFYNGLTELDRALPAIVDRLRGDDLMILTADHGNDPTTESTDHSRECVPILVIGPRVSPVSVGVRATFADIGATVAEYFGLSPVAGDSFLAEVAPWVML
ncbi:MAG: phosphopentomutase [Gemmatimonadota bacterium]|nr:MAG: phosphopentomutase [Gemmatimonadota bacterium]